MRSASAAILVALAATGAQGQQLAKLTADDSAGIDWFGSSVSLSGDTAVVGAYQDDDAGAYSGSAYVFREVAGVWQQIAKLTANDTAAGDHFGWSVSIDGDTAVVGARWDDEAGSNSGSAYVFREIDGVWRQIAKLTADDAEDDDEFGYCVSIDADTAVVGADRNDDTGSDSGSAYVFREVAGVWLQIAKLTADDAHPGDLFGYSVSLDGDTTLVGAYGYGDKNTGAAYVIREVAGVWQQIDKLTADHPAYFANFGRSVSLSGGTAVVGANEDNDAGTNGGAAYIFHEVAGLWQQIAQLIADDAAEDNGFGRSVSISGGTAVVGAWLDGDASSPRSGSAYVFREVAGVWKQIAKLTADDAAAEDYFGYSVSLSGDTALAGAYGDDDPLPAYGSAYVFRVGSPCPADLAEPYGVLDIDDALAFLTAFADEDPAADLAVPLGVFDFSDALAFLLAFTAGCP
ncbi:MAG: FG-GAP repeat protein [Phycisphaerales bacterium]